MRFRPRRDAAIIILLVAFLTASAGVAAGGDTISVVEEWRLDDILEDFWAVAPDGSDAFWSIDDDTVRKHELSDPTNILDSGDIPDDGNQEGLAKDGSSFWVVGHDEVWKEEIGASSPSKTYQPECSNPEIHANSFYEIKKKGGYLWVVRGSTETGIMKVDPDTGSCVEGWTFQLDDNREASGLAWDPDRNVWWLGVRANRIYKLDGGDPSNVLASYTVDGIENADGLAYINDYLYVADHDDSWFYKLELPAQEPDQSPTAHLTADSKQGPAPHEVTFALDADPGDNSVDSWELYYGDGDSTWGNGDPNDLQKTHTYQDPGSYDARLTVTDTAGKQDNATVTISVGEPDDAGNSQSTAKELSMGEEYEAEVGGSDSRDVFKAHVQKDHEIRITVDHLSDVDMDWEVEKPDGGVAMQEASGTGTETYDFIPESTAYTYVEVWPKDSSQTGQFSILFEDLGGESNDPPSASVSASPTSGDAPLDVTFEVSASDSDGFVDWWKIETDDGGMVEGEGSDTSAEYTYDEPGTYTAELTVHDDRGAQSEDRVTIQVGESDGSGSEEGSDDGTTGDSDAGDGSEGNRSAEIVGVDGVPDEYTEEPFEVQVYIRNTGDVEAKFRVTARERTGIQIGSTYGDGDETKTIRLGPDKEDYVPFTVKLHGTPGERSVWFTLTRSDGSEQDSQNTVVSAPPQGNGAGPHTLRDESEDPSSDDTAECGTKTGLEANIIRTQDYAKVKGTILQVDVLSYCNGNASTLDSSVLFRNTRGSLYVADMYDGPAPVSSKYEDSLFFTGGQEKKTSLQLSRTVEFEDQGVRVPYVAQVDVRVAYRVHLTSFVLEQALGGAPSEETLLVLTQKVKEAHHPDRPFSTIDRSEWASSLERYIKQNPEDLVAILGEAGIKITVDQVVKAASKVTHIALSFVDQAEFASRLSDPAEETVGIYFARGDVRPNLRTPVPTFAVIVSLLVATIVGIRRKKHL